MDSIGNGAAEMNKTPRSDEPARAVTIYPMAYETGDFTLIRGCMNHKEAGIKKRVSESVYPADILSDPAIVSSSIETRGAWFWELLTMWRDGTYEVTNDIEGFARSWGCSKEKAEAIAAELQLRKPCDFVTDSNGNITLKSRRLSRRHKSLQSNAERQKRHRENQDHNADVTGQNGFPSSSSSSSSSISTSKDKNILSDFEECWKLYPDKSGKHNAFKAYQKAVKEGAKQSDVLAGLNRYLEYVRQKRAGGFTDLKYKNGSTWFNQRCWEDEYIISKPERPSPFKNKG